MAEMLWREFDLQRVYLWRLPYGADLLAALTDFAASRGITSGSVTTIGAASEAVLGFYDQTAKKYREHHVRKPMEIASCVGNISMLDGKPVVHAHLVLSDEKGAAMGGHLMPGTRVFSCEAMVTRLVGIPMRRGHDEVTGLPLWQPEEP